MRSLVQTRIQEYEEATPAAKGTERKPFLRLPTSCQATQKSSIRADSWAEPGNWKESATELPSLQGCGQLPFTPSLKVDPESQAGSSPSGMKFNVHLPQVEHETAEGLAESDVKSTTVTLPQGVAAQPGRGAWSAVVPGGRDRFQWLPDFEPEVSTATFTSSLHEPFCEASKVGNVRIQTPLLKHELEGGVYTSRHRARTRPAR